MTLDLVLGIAMLGVAAMGIGGTLMIRRHKDVKKGVLMLTVAAVMLMNVLIIAWPR